MSAVFVEINPYHSVTLYPLCNNFADKEFDVVFAHPALVRDDLYRAIDCPKLNFGLFRFLKFILTQKTKECYFNTINPVLFPVTIETIRLNFYMLIAPLATYFLGVKNHAIVHDLHYFYSTDLRVDRRSFAFRKLIGWWYVKLFSKKFVLSQEVHEYQKTLGLNLELLNPSALSNFDDDELSRVSDPRLKGKRIFSMIGAIHNHRRSWNDFLDLDPEFLRKSNTLIVLICNIQLDEGSLFLEELKKRELDPFFLVFDYWPTDTELVQWVKISRSLFCVYGTEAYGRSKSSGTRIFAWGLSKQYISNYPAWGVYSPLGEQLRSCSSLMECIKFA